MGGFKAMVDLCYSLFIIIIIIIINNNNDNMSPLESTTGRRPLPTISTHIHR